MGANLLKTAATDRCCVNRSRSSNVVESAGHGARVGRAALCRILLTVMLGNLCVIAAAATDQPMPFNPIHKLSTWYTDRTLVDIEVTGSTDLVPEFHHLEPDRVLRLRLERAYIDQLITQPEPGFEIFGLSFDATTDLPSSLYFAVGNKGRLHETVPGVEPLSPGEAAQRTLLLLTQSNWAASTLKKATDVNRQCAGEKIDDGLWKYEWSGRSGCRASAYHDGMKYVADYASDLALTIECQKQTFVGLIACAMMFPFDGFGIRLGFHSDRLRQWRETVDHAEVFLKSKQYR
jgi:hypothetical protein